MKISLRLILFAALILQFAAVSVVSHEQDLVPQTGNTGAVSKAALSPDGTLVLTAASDKVVCLWEVESGLILHEFRGFKDDIAEVAFTPDGRSVVIGSGDRNSSANFEPLIRIFEVKTGVETKRIDHERAFSGFAISTDGQYLLGDSYYPSLYDLNTGKHLPNKFGYEAALSSGTNRIVFFDDKKINIFDIDAAKTLTFISVDFNIDKLAISADGSLVAALERRDHTAGKSFVYVWDAGSGKEVFKVEFLSADSLAFSPTDKLLAVAGKADYNTSGITLYDVSKQKQLVSGIKYSRIRRCVSVKPKCARRSRSSTRGLRSPIAQFRRASIGSS